MTEELSSSCLDISNAHLNGQNLHFCLYVVWFPLFSLRWLLLEVPKSLESPWWREETFKIQVAVGSWGAGVERRKSGRMDRGMQEVGAWRGTYKREPEGILKMIKEGRGSTQWEGIVLRGATLGRTQVFQRGQWSSKFSSAKPCQQEKQQSLQSIKSVEVQEGVSIDWEVPMGEAESNSENREAS